MLANSLGGVLKKWTARSGKPDPLHLVAPPAAHALMNRVVFAVDGQQRLALPARFGGDQIARGNQTFLVGEADCFTGLHGLVRGFQPGDTDDGADYEVGIGMSGHLHRSGRAVGHFDARRSSPAFFSLSWSWFGGLGGSPSR